MGRSENEKRACLPLMPNKCGTLISHSVSPPLWEEQVGGGDLDEKYVFWNSLRGLRWRVGISSNVGWSENVAGKEEGFFFHN